MNDVCLLGMGLLGLPQERIAQRLGMEQPLVNYHLSKTSELKNLINEQLKRGFFINTIAEKLGWDQSVISRDLQDFMQNGNSAEMHKPDPLRFADVWSFVECDVQHSFDCSCASSRLWLVAICPSPQGGVHNGEA